MKFSTHTIQVIQSVSMYTVRFIKNNKIRAHLEVDGDFVATFKVNNTLVLCINKEN